MGEKRFVVSNLGTYSLLALEPTGLVRRSALGFLVSTERETVVHSRGLLSGLCQCVQLGP